MLGDIMDKEKYISELYNDLKDHIQFDEDVLALSKILITMLKINLPKAINGWQNLIDQYAIDEMGKDIDFRPVTNDFLIELLKYKKIEEVFSLLSKIPKNKREIIETHFFNVFNNKSGIFEYIKRIIKENDEQKELEELKVMVKKNQLLDLYIFDSTTLLKKTIFFHIKSKNINIEALLKIAMLPKEKKEQAILKSLLIDYIE